MATYTENEYIENRKRNWFRAIITLGVIGALLITVGIVTAIVVKVFVPVPSSYQDASISEGMDTKQRIVVRTTRQDDEIVHNRVLSYLDSKGIEYHTKSDGTIKIGEVSGDIVSVLAQLKSKLGKLTPDYKHWPQDANLQHSYVHPAYSATVIVRDIPPFPLVRDTVVATIIGGIFFIIAAVFIGFAVLSDECVEDSVNRARKKGKIK